MLLKQDTEICVSICPSEYIAITTSPKLCKMCIDHFKAFSSRMQCGVRDDGYIYLSTPTPLCFKNCESGYYRKDRVCAIYQNDCTKCQNGSEFTECIANLYLF